MPEIQPQMMNVDVGSLEFGQDHPLFPANARKTDRTSGLEALAQSISDEGILQPLLIWRHEGKFWVVDGSRRLSAIHKLNDEGRPFPDTVPCLIFEGGEPVEAMSKSLTANITQLPLHRVDQFEAFREFYEHHAVDGGMPRQKAIDLIAGRYSVTPLVVERRLALGALDPIIREAWRAGEIDDGGAQALTLVPNPETQVSILEDLRKKNLPVDRSNVRRALNTEDRRIGQLLNFVGRDAYGEAGGECARDLFDETGLGDNVSDFELLHNLAVKKMEGFIANALEEGRIYTSQTDYNILHP